MRITDTVIQSYMCVSSILDVPPVHDVPEIPGLDDFTVYLIMAGSVADRSDRLLHRLLSDSTFLDFHIFSRCFMQDVVSPRWNQNGETRFGGTGIYTWYELILGTFLGCAVLASIVRIPRNDFVIQNHLKQIL